MGRAPSYSKPKRSGESMIVSVVLCIGGAIGLLALFPTFTTHLNFLLHATAITAHTTGAPHQIAGTFGQYRGIDYQYRVEGRDYHGSAALEPSSDSSGELDIFYDASNPAFNAVNNTASFLVMLCFGALIVLTCVSGVGALVLVRRKA